MKINWHHFKRVLTILGYTQTPSTMQGYLYFNHPVIGNFILEKHNFYPEFEIKKYLKKMKLPDPYFEPIYKKCIDK